MPVAPPPSAASRRASSQYRSTSSSYPSQGIRTPEPVDSPPATVKLRKFFSIRRYSKPEKRLSSLFSSNSSTEAVFDTGEGYRQPLEAVNDDTAESLSDSVIEGPPPLELEAADVEAIERQVEEPDKVAPRIDTPVENRWLFDKQTVNNPEARKSTDTIVKSSGDLSEAAKGNDTPTKSEVIDFGLSPAAMTNQQPEVDARSARHLKVPSRRSTDYLEGTRPTVSGQSS